MWVDRLSLSPSKDPVAEQAHPEWPRLLWSFCWHLSFVELKTVNSCKIPTVVSAQLEWESFSQWWCFLGRDLFIHAEGFSSPFCSMCYISKGMYGGIYNQKAAELGRLCVFASKNSNPFRGLIGGIMFVSAGQKLTSENKLYLASLFKWNYQFSLFRNLTERKRSQMCAVQLFLRITFWK